mgnify:CR=1 FL=1
MEKDISQAVIRRLPRYYRYLGELMEQGVERISSGELSDLMHVTASQIRQDLNNFGGFGQQGYGYNISSLHDEIGNILGVNEIHNIIIIGAGNLGQALANNAKFERVGFKVVALFDVDESLKGTVVRDIPVHMMDELEEFITNNDVSIATLTIPKREAEKIAERLVECGIKAIWNFAHVDLDFIGRDVVVENVHLSDSLMQLSYNITRQGKNNG